VSPFAADGKPVHPNRIAARTRGGHHERRENDMRRTSIFLALLVALALGLAACGGDEEEPAAQPAPAPAETEPAAPMEPAQAESDIVETAAAAGSFNTLTTALEAAGLVETLQGEGPYTVFAPTDEAFAALPAGTLDDLLKPENKDQLTAVLTYHVAEGSVASSDLSDGQMIPTLEGGELSVAITDAGVQVDDATVTAPDVSASNGVIHVVDTVLVPGA
jgi:uncharacterized surface protein with fasciclin (FAS1) repeats